MSDTLDRLKALNSKLEAKLSQKKSAGPEQATTLIDLMEEGKRAEKNEPIPAEPRRTKRNDKPADRSTGAKESDVPLSDEDANEARLLSGLLLHHLKIDSRAEKVRSNNIERLAELYKSLGIEKKSPDIRELFIYKAMNISGIGLKEEDFGEIREGKYVQVIAITYEPDKNGKKKAKNISLGYFGKAESLDPVKKNRVIEFVLRWRYEKAFQNLEHYRQLLEKVRPRESLF